MTTTPHQRWHVLGLGSMGTLAASRLLGAGLPVRALHAQESPLTRTLIRPGEAPVTVQLPVDMDGPLQQVLLAVKAPQTRAALTPLLPRLAPDALVLCLQNGMGTLDGIDLPSSTQVLYAVTTDGAWRDGTAVHVVAENATRVGGAGKMPDALSALAPHWPGWQWQADIEPAQWDKLAINAVINPLTALYDCRNGELLDQGPRAHHMAAVAAEVDKALPHWLPHWAGNTLARASAVARQTAANTSSMCADQRAGRETEIDFITGFLLRRASEYGLSLPENTALLEQLSRHQH